MKLKWSITQYTFIAFCIALNLGLGAIVRIAKLPFFLDSLGTILSTILIGLPGGIVVGLFTVVFASFIYSPQLWAYGLTAITIALLSHGFNKVGFFNTIIKSIISGLVIGVVAAIVSAPITVYLYGGISTSGQDFVTAFLHATGLKLLNSVVLAGFSTDPIDKAISAFIIFYLLKNIPQRIRYRLSIQDEE
jgi:energy-coupling factor transport system substrate-specific component